MIISHSILLRLRNVSVKFVEKIKTHILHSGTFPRKSCCMWDDLENIVEPDRPQMTRMLMRIVCWMPKATNIHSVYVILIAFPLIQLFPACVWMSRHCLPCCLLPVPRSFPFCNPDSRVIRSPLPFSSPDDRGTTVLWKMAKYFTHLSISVYKLSVNEFSS